MDNIIVLQRIETVDYTEKTDHENDLCILTTGCLDSLTDYMYAYNSKNNPWKENCLVQLEFTARAILDKYKVDLDEEVFGLTKIMSEDELSHIGNLIVEFGSILCCAADFNTDLYDESDIHSDIKETAIGAYSEITGVLQYLTCQQTKSSESISTV